MYGKSTLAAGSAGGAMLPFTGGVILTVVALLTVLFAVLAGTKLVPARQA
jgi:hypothetical protein